MPRVPTYDSPQVAERPQGVPVLSINPDDGSAAVGQAVERLGGQITSTANELGQIAIEAKQKADRTAGLAAETTLSQYAQTKVYDPQTGFRSLQGNDAVAQSEPTYQDIAKKRDELMGNLRNDAQRQMFLERSNGLLEGTKRDIDNHTFQQVEAVHDATDKAAVGTQMDRVMAVYGDPERRTQEIQALKDTYQATLDRKGLPPEVRQHATDQMLGEAAKNVALSMLDSGNAAGARQFLDAPVLPGATRTNRQIMGEAGAAIENRLRPLEMQVKADALANDIVSASRDPKTGLISEVKATEAARALKVDPLVREMVAKQVKERSGEIDTARKHDQATLYDAAYQQIVDPKNPRRHSMSGVDAGLRSKLWAENPDGYGKLEAAATAWQKERDSKEPDPKRVLAFGDFLFALNHGQLDGMTPAQFNQEWGSRLALKDLMPAMKEFTAHTTKPNEPQHEKPVYDYMTQVLQSNKLIPDGSDKSKKVNEPGTWDEKERSVLNTANRLVYDYLQTYKTNHPTAPIPPPDDFQRFVNAKVIEGRDPDAGWWSKLTGNDKKTAIQQEAEGKPPLPVAVPTTEVEPLKKVLSAQGVTAPTDEQLSTAYRNKVEIPIGDRSNIERALRSLGKPVTEDNIRRAFEDGKARSASIAKRRSR